ncbi:uncharacterized protein LOC117641891 isoform X2 [Thrips palmi]|uniref:Uncharacterized protein LOC117641891 isoform X2 n=1 Tax=Thrips palmi TaxID=161013 RepID=A0A6P8Y7E6_THRPL|nr:uncharacterized protein LOC117641891 isoform X2 [Thrips palmi]
MARATKALRVVALLTSLQHGGAVSLSDIPIIGAQIKGTHLELRPIAVGRCEHLQHALVKTAVTYRMSGRTRVVMDVDVTVNQSVKQYTQMLIELTKCKDVVSDNSCTPSSPVVQREGVCAAIHAPLMPWTDLINKIHPTPRCPILEGNYKAHNFSIDMTGVDSLLSKETKTQQLEGFVWRARMLFFEHEAIHLCFEAIFEFVRVRNSAGRLADRVDKRGQASSTVQPRRARPESTVAPAVAS